MTLGIFLIVIGAVLTFALNWHISSLDLDVVGWILMAAGVVSVILALVVFGPRKRRQVTQRRTYQDGGETVDEERRYDSGGSTPPPA